MDTHVLDGGFADPAIDAAHAFRTVMDVMARPGRIAHLTGATPPAPLSRAAGTVLLTLCDADTPLWLGPSIATAAVRDWITFHTAAPITAPAQALFGFGTWDELPLPDFPTGTPDYPDRSATLVVDLPDLTPEGATLRGPGIKDSARLSLPDPAAFQANARMFPLGLDFIFTAGDRIAALPRSTRVG